ncbi:hypothetical protein [Pseudodesulfovibrio sediminis]|uniref:Uncharacterized protein n=1 Tax=Pseudodesulfovibrio sediminis TaxID=2810563 RepID=A0ABM7P7H0_9BACT|nr:hypothetical protein [Pseudodesulfovibrio sediminis]BCS89305.1 hypothetical protein PSDVSF_25470 [Pseudodesulfovibrio sediminis]
MRISGHASEQYRKTSALAEKKSEKRTVTPQARTTTTSFGFRLGKFGLDYQSEKTTLDPSLSRDVREKKEQAEAFKTEAEVESLRAKVGAEGASFREQETASSSTDSPSQNRVRTALTAYAKSGETIYPPPGNMLASVI